MWDCWYRSVGRVPEALSPTPTLNGPGATQSNPKTQEVEVRGSEFQVHPRLLCSDLMASWSYMRSFFNSNRTIAKMTENTGSTKDSPNYKDQLIFPGRNSEDLAWVACLGYKTFAPGTRIQPSCPFPTYQAAATVIQVMALGKQPRKGHLLPLPGFQRCTVTHRVAGHSLKPHSASWSSLDPH